MIRLSVHPGEVSLAVDGPIASVALDMAEDSPKHSTFAKLKTSTLVAELIRRARKEESNREDA